MKRLRYLLLALLALVLIALVASFRPDRDPATLEVRYATPPSQFIDVGGARVHYRDRGSGPAIGPLQGDVS